MALLFWEELLDFHAPKQPHRSSEDFEKPQLEARDKALREYQDHSLWPLLCTVLQLGMRSMKELPSSFDDAIKDLKEMRHLSRLVTPLLVHFCTLFYTFRRPFVSPQGHIRRGFKEHEVGARHHCFPTAIVACLNRLSSSAHGSAKCLISRLPRVSTCLVTTCLGSGLVHNTRWHHRSNSHGSSTAVAAAAAAATATATATATNILECRHNSD